MRYAAYIRISSEDQIKNFSVDAQRRTIEAWVEAQGGTLTSTYIDEGFSGKVADRPAFLEMRRDAKAHKFDVLVVHKFDRFARNRTDALAIKSLLRHDCGVKVYSVLEPSEDSDGPIGALIEGIMEDVAAWYSQNLAQETSKGKRERALQGLHNNKPPFGYDKDENGVLIPNPHELVGLHRIFDLYETGQASDNQIAVTLNSEGYKQKHGKPFNTEVIRGILQNRLYLGEVKYRPTKYRADGSLDRVGYRAAHTSEKWLKGKHQAVISAEQFTRCQQIRFAKATHHEYYPKHRVYLLQDLIYCTHCIEQMPVESKDPKYGRMRAYNHSVNNYGRYRCVAHDNGRECPQKNVRAEVIEQQVIHILKTLVLPTDWHDRIVQAMGDLIGEKRLDERIREIKEVIARMDFRWDHGFIADQQAYLNERVRLQQELEKLTPIVNDELETAADLLMHFSEHWDALDGDLERQQVLIHLIVARVLVRDKRVVGLTLRANYHLGWELGNRQPRKVQLNFLGEAK